MIITGGVLDDLRWRNLFLVTATWLLTAAGGASADSLLVQICTRHPDMPFCQAMRPAIERSIQSQPRQSAIVKQPPLDNNITRIVNSNVVLQYCRNYSAHFEYFCSTDPATHGEQAKKFCHNYAKACNQQLPIDSRLIGEYCTKYKSDYDKYCSNPLEYGAQAIQFCPKYSDACGSSFSQPLLSGTGQSPLAAGNAGGGGGDAAAGGGAPDGQQPQLSAEQIKRQCDQGRALANQFCFGPSQTIGYIQERCALFKQYCV